MKMKASIKLVGCALLCATVLTACSEAENMASTPSSSAASAASTATKNEATTIGYVTEMDKNAIMTFAINVDEAQWQDMLDHAAEEEYISADVTINGTTIKNVGIRPKGNSSLSKIVNDDTTDRYSFKIKFDEYVDGQTWKGLDQIVVNNMDSDNSYMKEYLSYDIMSYIGVDAPLYAFADIDVNGKSWGFYLAVEVLDSGYLDRTKDGEGELYKPNNDNQGIMGGMGGPQNMAPNNNDAVPGGAGSGDTAATGTAPAAPPADSTTAADTAAPAAPSPEQRVRGGGGGRGMNGAQNGVSLTYTDSETDSYSAIFDNAETKTTEEDHQRVITALQNLSAGTDLDTFVDVEAVLKYFAAHTVVVNMDSYTSNMGHNYYLYENNGQISILPWDYNLAFGGFQGGEASDVVNLAIDTPVSGIGIDERPLLAKLLEVPEYKEQYHAYLQDIIDGYFADGKFEETVNKLDQLIAEHVKNDPSAFTTFEAYQTAIAELTKLGTLRAESIQGQLDGDIPSTTEAQQKDAGKLIDASSIDLSKLGNHGPGGGGPGGGGFGGPGEFPGGMDRGQRPQPGSGSTSQPSTSTESN